MNVNIDKDAGDPIEIINNYLWNHTNESLDSIEDLTVGLLIELQKAGWCLTDDEGSKIVLETTDERS
jgi:hypothetical protein